MSNHQVLEAIGHIEIPLSGKHGEDKYALVDDDYDGEYFSQFRWFLIPGGYAVRSIYENGKKKQIYLHHEVLRDCPPNMVRDHINRNKLDNRSCNLRVVTWKENAANRPAFELINLPNGRAKKSGNSVSGSEYIGVRQGKNYRKGKTTLCNFWWVKVKHEYVGSFPSPELAAQAYDKKAYEFWGERATLNFPELLEAQRKDN